MRLRAWWVRTRNILRKWRAASEVATGVVAVVSVVVAVLSYKQAGSANTSAAESRKQADRANAIAQQALNLQKQGWAADTASDAGQVRVTVTDGSSDVEIDISNGSRHPMTAVKVLLVDVLPAHAKPQFFRIETGTVLLSGCRTAKYFLDMSGGPAKLEVDLSWKDSAGSTWWLPTWYHFPPRPPILFDPGPAPQPNTVLDPVLNTVAYTGGLCG